VKLRQVSVRIDRPQAERAEALLNLAEPLALTFDDAADAPLFEPEPGTTPLWPELLIHALFPADFDAESLSALLTEVVPEIHSVELRQIEAADWQAGLEQNVFVQCIAENLCVVPADFDLEPPAAQLVRLNMGLAFGTGRHPTTLLCLEWLAQHPPESLRVCDFGCGSGVLAIAALRLGATQAIAIDNDPQAVRATRANAKLNQCEDLLSAGAPEDFPQPQVDVVLANILAGTLSESVERLAQMLEPGGTIVLSGILENQIAATQQAFEPLFDAFEHGVRDDWARITARLR
jgi:ribosomal protein L11 methyltransferase